MTTRNKKFTYWYIRHQKDADCYSIIAKTRKAALAELLKRGEYIADYIGETNGVIVEQKVIDYSDTFDLFDWITGENSGRDIGYTTTWYRYTKRQLEELRA